MTKNTKIVIAMSAVAAVAAWWWFIVRKGNMTAPGGFAKQDVYPPNSQVAKDLFRFVAIKYGLPLKWVEDRDLHWIMGKESKGGQIGIPNYTFGHPPRSEWPKLWARLRNGERWTSSSATGLGQLQADNVNTFYPDKMLGIGDPENEAAGYIRYIKSRYGSPAVARSVYGRGGKGEDTVYYIHAITGKKMGKEFKEGY